MGVLEIRSQPARAESSATPDHESANFPFILLSPKDIANQQEQAQDHCITVTRSRSQPNTFSGEEIDRHEGVQLLAMNLKPRHLKPRPSTETQGDSNVFALIRSANTVSSSYLQSPVSVSEPLRRNGGFEREVRSTAYESEFSW